MNPFRIALHWQILLGMVAGVAAGVLLAAFGGKPGIQFTENWITPFGTIFLNLLKLLAIPLIITSLIKGISDLQDISKFSLMGGRTIALYLFTTLVAIVLGLVIANVVDPGDSISDDTRQQLLEMYQDEASQKSETAKQTQARGPLQPLVDIVPENIFASASSNGNMLQMIFVVIFFGVAMILVPGEAVAPVKAFFDGLNLVVLKLVDLCMMLAPLGVFSLLCTLVAETQSVDLLISLGKYSLCVLLGLALMTFVFYPLLIVGYTGRSYLSFFRGISPAQLLAFSTSSSAATLPVTMECVEEKLGVDGEVASFVLPVGATVNMDGTSLYQAVAAIFIAGAYGMDLTLYQQMQIVLTATLSSIGSAAVPGAGMVMLVIVLENIGVPVAGLALIFAVDRVLDMCRTVVNVTGDATVSMLVAKSVDKLNDPNAEAS